VRDRPKEDPLGFCFRKSLVIEPDLQHPKHGNQEADYGSEQRGSTPEPFDLDDSLGTLATSEITGNDIRRAVVNPASNGRSGDLQLGEERANPSSISVSGFADCFLDSVVVGSSRVESFHLKRVGRGMREGGAARKWQAPSGRCSCNASDPECHETQQRCAREPIGSDEEGRAWSGLSALPPHTLLTHRLRLRNSRPV